MKTFVPHFPHFSRSYRTTHRILAGLLWLLALAPAWGQTVFHNPEYQWVVDIPVGWEVLDASHTSIISFSDPERVAVFQVISFPGDQFVTVQEIDQYIRERFGAAGNAAPFRFHQDHAIFADYRFASPRQEGDPIPLRGYMAFINGDEFAHAVLTFAVEDYYEELHDHLLSALDSFSMDRDQRLLPGLVSVFSMDGAPGEPAGHTLTLPSGEEIPLPGVIASDYHREASQVLIEREARVLQPHAPQVNEPLRFAEGHSETAPPWAQAWRRYYRMLYRDNYERLAPVSEALFHDLARSGVPREEMPQAILSWLQGAEYRRTNTLSDLMNPSWCLVDFAGDCDSLGLTYAIILDHLGFDAVLMVSLEYAHAMVGIDIPGAGARFPFDERQWLVAELTAPVALGQIEASMSDVGGWVGIKLDPTR